MRSEALSRPPFAAAFERHPSPPYASVVGSLGKFASIDHHMAQGACSKPQLEGAAGVLWVEVAQQNKGLLLPI